MQTMANITAFQQILVKRKYHKDTPSFAIFTSYILILPFPVPKTKQKWKSNDLQSLNHSNYSKQWNCYNVWKCYNCEKLYSIPKGPDFLEGNITRWINTQFFKLTKLHNLLITPGLPLILWIFHKYLWCKLWDNLKTIPGNVKVSQYSIFYV